MALWTVMRLRRLRLDCPSASSGLVVGLLACTFVLIDCDRSFRRGLIGPMEGSMVRMIVVAACSLAVFSATAQDRWVTDDQYAEMQ